MRVIANLICLCILAPILVVSAILIFVFGGIFNWTNDIADAIIEDTSIRIKSINEKLK